MTFVAKAGYPGGIKYAIIWAPEEFRNIRVPRLGDQERCPERVV
jgi:hypothetical protein